jgi:DNA segregation ATPase FtsK/SpoIIIE-like protein
MKMEKLQTDIQTFQALREGKFLYVDKTRQMFDLISRGRVYFLSRPRRFGKSLLLSTFESLFNAEEELFKGLFIHDHWDWKKKYPVIKFDMSKLSTASAEILERDLNVMLELMAENKKVQLKPSSSAMQFSQLIQRVYLKEQQTKVVILIDEYDEAIRASLDKTPEIRNAIKETMREFYKILKAEDQYIHFVFLTGVSKFSGLAIFSALNNIKDITLNPNYADICGYTQTELETHFDELISELAKSESYSPEKTLKEIKYWYNGYTWDGKTAIYNPYSTLNLFTDLEFSNYWLQTGTPGFLASLVRQKKYSELLYQQGSFDKDDLLGIDMERLTTPVLLFQAGYLL